MASAMFVGTLMATKHYRIIKEERVPPEETSYIRDIWKNAEGKCYQRYVQECDDTGRTHVYNLLVEKIQECRRLMRSDNTRGTMENCHNNILQLSDICGGRESLPAEARIHIISVEEEEPICMHV